MRALSFAEMDIVAGGEAEPTVVIVQGKKKNPNTIYASSISTTPTINMPNAGQLVPIGGFDPVGLYDIFKDLLNMAPKRSEAQTDQSEQDFKKTGVDVFDLEKVQGTGLLGRGAVYIDSQSGREFLDQDGDKQMDAEVISSRTGATTTWGLDYDFDGRADIKTAVEIGGKLTPA